ncbi:MAG: aldo/keto reductase [Clostridiales bacterium]|nr:aldo/keto reductase [Clostridiales bacterium]
MVYRDFNGKQVSLLGYGCMRLPTEDAPNGKKKPIQSVANELLTAAVEGGVTYFDTAYPYTDGNNEAAVAEALKDVREKVTIATKLPIFMVKEAADMERFLDEQLKRLNTEKIDVYLIHGLGLKRLDLFLELGGREFLDKAQADGKIGMAGFSCHDGVDGFKKTLDCYNWGMTQVQYNIMDKFNQASIEGVRYAGKKQVPVVIMEGLRGGDLANAPKAVKEIYDGSGRDWSAPEWGFRFVANEAEIKCILSGMTSMDMLNDNLRIFSGITAPGTFTESDHATCDAVRAMYEKLIQVPCTGCSYCQPCPQNIRIPSIMTQFNRVTMFDAAESAKKSYLNIVKEDRGADRCVRCGLCESKCPQDIRIMDELAKIHSYFTE